MSKVLIAITICVLFQVAVSQAVEWEINDPTLPQAVIDYFGSREMRYHHFLWHNLRENWLSLDASTQHSISKLGWAPPRPAGFYRDNGDQIVLEFNDSGEDFLYMHRQMVKKVNEMVAGTPYGKIKGWSHVPAPGDPKWPVPEPYAIPGDTAFTELIATAKSDAFFFNVIQPMEEELNDENNMRAWTLGQFGAKVEFTVHTWMHLRFSEVYEPIGLRNTGTANPTPEIDTKYDNVNYRWLGDTYSSHVNPVFWKIHGWVDNKIEQWRKANGLETIEWKGTWVSGPFEVYEDLFAAGEVNDDNDVDPSVTSPAEEAVKILLATGKPDYFRRASLKPLAP